VRPGEPPAPGLLRRRTDTQEYGRNPRLPTAIPPVQQHSKFTRSLSLQENLSSADPSKDKSPRYSPIDSNPLSHHSHSMQFLNFSPFGESSSFEPKAFNRRPSQSEGYTSSPVERSHYFPRSPSFERSDMNTPYKSSSDVTFATFERYRSTPPRYLIDPQPSSPENFSSSSRIPPHPPLFGRSISYEGQASSEFGFQFPQVKQSRGPKVSNALRTSANTSKSEIFRRSISFEGSSITSVPAPVFGRRPSSSTLPHRRPLLSRRLSII